MNTLNIGLLLPTSTIFPMGKQFEKGMKEVFAERQMNDAVEITKEFIGQGSVNQTQNIINKLFNYDDVDLITGILSNKLAENFSPIFNTRQKPFIINNLGENFPIIDQLNSYVFTSTFSLWQHAWSLGYWGVKTFGKKGMYVSSVYDAGYSFSQMFHEGMKAADVECEWSFSVPPMPPQGQSTDVSIIFPFLEQYQPDFVFATFCGTETTLFINEFIARGWHKKTRLLGLPFLLDPFAPLNDDITIYTTAIDATRSLKPSDCFYYMGRQSAGIIADALSNGTGNLHENLKSNDGFTKANNHYFLQHSPDANGNIIIIENNIKAVDATFETKVIDEVQTFSLDDLSQFEIGNPFGWTNPYMCV